MLPFFILALAHLFESNKNKLATSLSDTYTKLVDYATGYSRRLDTAVRQNILWGVKECNQNTADRIGEEFGSDGREVSYHSNPRPSHEDMGGKQFALGKARTVKGKYYPSFEEKAEPLLKEYNCLHFSYPILLGISEPTYSPEQIDELKERDKRTFEFEGEEYTGYEATQMQRKLETAIRTQKDRSIMARKAGNEDEVLKAQEQINLLTSKYAKFSKEANLPTRMERIQVAGFRSTKIPQKPLTNGGEGGIIKVYTKASVEDIPSMDKERFNKIKLNLEKRGIRVIQDSDGDDYLKAMNAEAMTLSDGSAIIFQSHRVPSASACFEEIIHTAQIKTKGMINTVGNNDGYIEYLNREIEANEKVLRNSKAYGLTALDKESVMINLQGYKDKLKEVK